MCHACCSTGHVGFGNAEVEEPLGILLGKDVGHGSVCKVCITDDDLLIQTTDITQCLAVGDAHRFTFSHLLLPQFFHSLDVLFLIGCLAVPADHVFHKGNALALHGLAADETGLTWVTGA